MTDDPIDSPILARLTAWALNGCHGSAPLTDPEAEEDPKEDTEARICARCAGSGEGLHDGSRCACCHGSGEVLTDRPDLADYY